MNIEQMKRAVQIQNRLERIAEATRRLNEPSTEADLMAYLGCWRAGHMPEQLPQPVFRFKQSCLDLLASEKAALEAEFAAL